MGETRLAIVADDLTGALDSAAAFAAVPGGVVVATRPEALCRALAERPGVVAVSTRSRDVAPDIARARVARVLADLPAGVRLFKKIDSRLKGNIGAELAAVPGPLLVAPAIPDFGRIVRDGLLSGFGVDRPLDVVPALGAVAHRAIIPDTPDAPAMSAALDEAPDDACLVGARGLARALAERWGLLHIPRVLLPGPALMAIGSVDPITRGQIAALRAARADALFIDAPDGAVPAPTRLDHVGLALLATSDGAGASAATVARRFARGLPAWLPSFAGLMVSGGGTAEAVLQTLDLDVLHLKGEALPGLPLIRAGRYAIVTKSGGFGQPETLVDLAAQSAAAEV